MTMKNKLRTSARWRRGLRALPLALGLLALAAFRGPADENPVVVIARRLGAWYANNQPEKAYLHLDRSAYGTGETIWFSAYVVDAQRLRPDSASRVLYVELLSPNRHLVARRTLQLTDGLSHGDLALDDTLRAGTYLLRAYTNWMRNAGPEFFYQRRLQVFAAAPNQPDKPAPLLPTKPAAPGAVVKTAAGKPDVQFFAEGGNLVVGLPATLGFKAQLATGRGVAASGQVLDDLGKVVVAAFKAEHAGMGRLAFVPVAGRRYHARVLLPDGGGSADYPLPAVQPTGYTLHVTDAGASYTVEARYKGENDAPPTGPVALVTEVRGYLIGLAPHPITGNGQPVSWELSKARYPNGILHLTLFDAQSQPQAERLAFVLNGPAALHVTLTPDQASYNVRTGVHLKVRVADAAGQPVATRLSVAVAEAGAAGLDATAGTIASNLLLTSDLVGYVENPDYYVQNPSPETSRALDNLLLTQGWRRFVWKQVLADTPAPPPPYPSEQSLTLAGVVTGMGQVPLPNSQLTFIQTKPVRNLYTGSTGPDGRFRFTGFGGSDTAVVTLQARRSTGGTNVIIRPDKGPPTEGQPLPPLPGSAAPGVADYLRRSRQQQVAERQNLPDGGVRNVELGTVAVTAQKPASVVPPDDTRRRYAGVVANTMIDFTQLPEARSGMTVLQVIQTRVPGLTISGSPPNQTVSIRNSSTPPMLLLDGAQTDMSFVNALNAIDIEAVEVFKGAETTIFGSQAGGGVIAIYTKRGDKNYKGEPTGPQTQPTGLLTVKVPGYYPAREFYQPRYGAPMVASAAAAAPAADPRRLTLYFAPDVSTNAKGETDIYFFTAEVGGNYQATAEGISLGGVPCQGKTTFYVAPK